LLLSFCLLSIVRADEPVTRLTKTHFSKFFLRYSPSGSHIVYSRHYANRRAANQILVGLHLVKADGTDDRRLLAEFDREVQIQEHPSWSPDGKRLVAVNTVEQLFVVDADGKNRAQILQVDGSYCHQPEWSPDGGWIAFA